MTATVLNLINVENISITFTIVIVLSFMFGGLTVVGVLVLAWKHRQRILGYLRSLKERPAVEPARPRSNNPFEQRRRDVPIHEDDSFKPWPPR